jgi:hypothetical protein
VAKAEYRFKHLTKPRAPCVYQRSATWIRTSNGLKYERLWEVEIETSLRQLKRGRYCAFPTLARPLLWTGITAMQSPLVCLDSAFHERRAVMLRR